MSTEDALGLLRRPSAHDVEEVTALFSAPVAPVAAAALASDELTPGFAEVAASDDAAWQVIAASGDADEPQHAEFRRWMTAQRRADVRLGRARWYTIREADAITAHGGLYADGDLVRYASIGTVAGARRRGHAERLVRAMRRVEPQATAIICALRDSSAEGIYRRAGFTPACRRRSIVAAPF